MCAFFEPVIVATYKEGAWRNFQGHSFRRSFGHRNYIKHDALGDQSKT